MLASNPSGVQVLSLAKVRLFIKEQSQTGYGHKQLKVNGCLIFNREEKGLMVDWHICVESI